VTGMDAKTGRRLSDLDHLRQSIRDILTTPIGTRVMRRDYGSRLFELVDAPINRSTLMDIYAATAEALPRWESRFRLERVRVEAAAADGRVQLTLSGRYLPAGKPVSLEGIVV